MNLRHAWQVLGRSPIYRLAMFLIGCVLMILAPIVSPLPGPGGIVLFGLGLGLVLRNSFWAKRRYAALKRTRPKLGGWADWGLRRKTARRKARQARELERAGN